MELKRAEELLSAKKKVWDGPTGWLDLYTYYCKIASFTAQNMQKAVIMASSRAAATEAAAARPFQPQVNGGHHAQLNYCVHNSSSSN